jgi:Bacterial DNA polymerase III alpha NTPase domain
MKQNKFGELIFAETDVMDLVMQGRDLSVFEGMIVDDTVDLTRMPDSLDPVPGFQQQKFYTISVPEWHARQQDKWHMPEEYKQLDIAAHVLGLCNSEAELQRCGQELLLYQERDLFNLLRYLKYLVDVMTENNIIWGVGRGSSVASFVLYKLGVHRIDSLHYNLDVHEFLR